MNSVKVYNDIRHLDLEINCTSNSPYNDITSTIKLSFKVCVARNNQKYHNKSQKACNILHKMKINQVFLPTL